MPGAYRYEDPNSQARKGSFEGYGLDKERRTRQEAYRKAHNYYMGKQASFLDKKDGEPDDNVVINLFKISVDRTVSMLIPAMPKMEITPETMDETPDEKWLRDAWTENDALAFLHKVVLNGALSGHCYVRVIPPKGYFKYPRLQNISPTNVMTWWRSDDMDTVLWHEIYWDDGTEEHLLDFVFDNDIGSWKAYEYARQGSSNWEQINVMDWKHPYGPIIAWPHVPVPNNYYGLSEATNLALNDKVNLVMSENMRINRYHASPKTIAIGIEPDEIEVTAIDGLWSTAQEKANIYNLEMKSAAPAFSMGLIEKLTDAFMSEQRVVVLRGDVAEFQRVTNPGIRTVFMEMLAKNNLLRWQYGRAIQKITVAMGFAAGKSIPTPDLIWADPLPSDDTELMNILEKEVAMGLVALPVASAKRGYDWKEQQRMKQMISESEAKNNQSSEEPLTNQNSVVK